MEKSEVRQAEGVHPTDLNHLALLTLRRHGCRQTWTRLGTLVPFTTPPGQDCPTFQHHLCASRLLLLPLPWPQLLRVTPPPWEQPDDPDGTPKPGVFVVSHTKPWAVSLWYEDHGVLVLLSQGPA